MNRPKRFSNRNFTCPFLFAALCLIVATAFSRPVSPGEATAIADLWYAMELNSGYLKIAETERADKLAGIGSRQVMYLVSKDELLAEFPQGRQVLAYVVTYNAGGFVVVSGDDRIEPLMVCSAVSRFWWDEPKLNFLRYYLGTAMPALWSNMPAQTHRNWSLLRSKLAESKDRVTYDNMGKAVYVLWSTAFWHQWNFYNDTCQAHNNNNYVPTGCVATAMAIKMRFHGWPLTGNGSHDYSDTLGGIQYDHSVNIGAQSYNWTAMPTETLAAANAGVARIMYHAGVSVDMDYELDASSAYTEDAGPALNSHFRYRGTLGIYDTTGPGAHEPRMQTSIIGKLPVQIGGSGHSVVTDGYRDDIANRWHINCGWHGRNNGWYRLDSLPWSGGGVITKSCPYGQPNNWIYVNGGWTGTEDGRIAYPYNTLSEGEAATINQGELLIRTGTYTGTSNVPITFDNAVAIRAYAGDVVIGENVRLTNYQAIDLTGNGQLKITPAKSSR